MKILWVTNLVVGAMHMKIYGKVSNGLWMDALLKDFVSHSNHDLAVVTTGVNSDIVFLEEGRVRYYILPGGNPNEYNHKNQKNIKIWCDLIKKESPDVIQVWGSEYKHGLAAVKAAPQVPSVVYMQGVLDSVARYYLAGITHKELLRSVTFWDILKKKSMPATQRKYCSDAKYEKEMLTLTGNIISENNWCNAHCKAIVPEVLTHYCPLSINEVFQNRCWSSDAMSPRTIMVNASGPPYKGLHIALKAIHLVKRRYPDVMLYIPGTPVLSGRSFKSRIKKTGYTKYIEKLIKQLDIKRNISFIGRLSPEEMAAKMETANVFVLASSIENHSSTLKEAMQVGTPCISSIAGGIPEYAVHNENALLYRFEEYELLAEYIINIFENGELAERLSSNARSAMSRLHDTGQIYDNMVSIYEKVIETKAGKVTNRPPQNF